MQQEQFATERRDDMLRFAQHQHRAQELLGRQGRPGLHRSALASIGKVLSEVGDQLQRRYGEETQPVGSYQLETAG